MEGVIWECPPDWAAWLPPGVRRVESAAELAGRQWTLLALTAAGMGTLEHTALRCRVALVPGECASGRLRRLQAESVVTWGLSPRDSLTLSSLAQPVLCVQRTLLRPDGGVVEPQEIPLPPLPAPAPVLLPLLGLCLLRMPLTESPFPW